jgi:hypothetical protein
MKPCVACAEEIQNAAKLCRFCGTRQDDVSFLSAAKASTSHDAPSLTGGRQLEGELATSGSPALKIFLMASLVVIPSILLLLLDSTLSDGGALEGVGNFAASLGGWAVLGVLTTAVLFATPVMRTPARRRQLKILLLSFGGWAVLALFAFTASLIGGLVEHTASVGMPDGATIQAAPPPPQTDPKQGVAPSEASRANCLTYLQYDWGEYGTGEDSNKRRAEDMAALWQPEGDIALRRLGLNLAAGYSELALAWSSFDSDLFDSASERLLSLNQEIEGRCAQLLG